MQNDEIYYHRTATGLGEVRCKTHGLTQSERLVLIIIDGVTPCSGLRAKLKGLADGRFESALSSLLNKGLVAEGVAPRSDSPTDFLNSNLIAGFLRQDPLDPVTISAPEGWEHGQITDIALPTEKPATPASRVTKVDFYIPLEPVVRQSNVALLDAEQAPRPIFIRTAEVGRAQEDKRVAGDMRLQPAWLVFAGLLILILIIVFEVVR